MVSKVLILCCCALTLLSCNGQDNAETSRSTRQVDGAEGSDFEVSGKSGSSKTDFHDNLRLACQHTIEDFRDVAERSDIADVLAPFINVLEVQDKDYFVHKKLYPSK